MVYKIRNKGLFMTINGFKNNYYHKVLNDYMPLAPDSTYALQIRQDHFSYLRIIQAYRNISRKTKQYFYGDKEAEQCFILFLQNHFTRPLRGETPLHLIKYGAARRFADQIERDYELVSYNQHPHQLDCYDTINQRLKEDEERNALLEQGEKPLDVQLLEVMKVKIDEAKERKRGKLTVDEYHNLYEEVFTQYRATEYGGQVRGNDGEFKDFLEKRRPFVDGNGHIKTD